MTSELPLSCRHEETCPKKPLAQFPGRLVLLGAGKMGHAMLDGWLARGLDPRKLIVLEPQPGKAVKALARRGLKLNPKGKPAEAAAIVIAVKPQSAPDALPALAPYAGKRTLALSIMAGRTLGFLADALPAGTAHRARHAQHAGRHRPRHHAWPAANAKVSARQRKLASDLLAAIGAVEWVSDEALMDAVTAVSGSGPAYVFLLAEAMTQGRHRRRAAARARRAAGARDRGRFRRIAASLGRSMPPRCGRTSPRPAAPPPPRSRC